MNQCLAFDQNASWRARLKCDFHRASSGRTQLARLSHEGPLRIQKLFHDHDLAHCYLLHPPGGLVSGDNLSCEFNFHSQSKALITTPASGKIYRARGNGSLQTVETIFEVKPRASCVYVPQDTIVYDDAHGELNNQVSVASDAMFFGWEHLVFGRLAGAQPFCRGQIMQSLTIKRDNRLFYRDRLNMTPQVVHELCGLSSMTSFASATLVTPDDFEFGEDVVAICRAVLKDFSGIAGVSAIRKHLIAIRLLSNHAEKTKIALETLWASVGKEMLDRTVQIPRIWRT